MADASTVCSMCGDVGFPEKLFHCTRCLLRFQHSYCSNYYDEEPSINSSTASICDWCLSEERTHVKHGPSSKKHATTASSKRLPGSGCRSGGDSKTKKSSSSDDQEESRSRGKSSGTSSSKPGGQRYKLLKDVLH